MFRCSVQSDFCLPLLQSLSLCPAREGGWCRPQVFTGGLGSYSVASMCLAHLQAEGIAVRDTAPRSHADAAAPNLRPASSATADSDCGDLLRAFLLRFGSTFR